MNSLTLTECDDASFGPAVSANDCRGGFDFTLLFEEVVLTLVPAAFFLALAPVRALRLLRRRIRVKRKALYIAKLLAIGLYAGLQLALLVLGISPQTRTRISIAAATLSLVSALSLGVLSHLEHSKSIRPSFLISVYLSTTVIFDAVRVRTQWLIGGDDAVAATLSASLAAKCVVLLLEGIEKRQLLVGYDGQSSIESTSGLYSRGLFWWLNSLLLTGFKSVLTVDNLPSISEKLDSTKIGESIEAAWNSCDQRRKHALAIASTWTFRWEVAYASVPQICLIGLNLSLPFLIQDAVTFVQTANESDSIDTGYGLIGGFAFVFISLAITTGWSNHLQYRMMTMLRGGLISLVYGKLLELPSVNESAAMALMSNDVTRIAESYYNLLFNTWPEVIQLSVAIYLLYLQLGIVCIAPVIVTIISTVLCFILASRVNQRQKAWLEFIERRINFTTEILGSMRNVKILGLTTQLSNTIQQMRDEEIDISKRYRRVQALNIALRNIPSTVTIFLLFGAYAIKSSIQGNSSFTVAQAVTSSSLLTLASDPLGRLLYAIPEGWAALGCFRRIQKFLQQESRHDTRSIGLSSDESTESSNPNPSEDEWELQPILRSEISAKVATKKASFGWSTTSDETVHNANMTLPISSKLVILIGPVGCGKSTFLKGLLGETATSKGHVYVSDPQIAYCDQSPWIMNGSIRDNIVGESEYDEDWYSAVVKGCALDVDLRFLPSGDATKVGSKGVKLSGGQKQRLSLARAVYARKQIAILDDILSGLDSRTEEVVFREVFSSTGLFAKTGTTVILATHSVKHLPRCDFVMAMNEDGELIEQGTFSQLNVAGTYVNSLRVKLHDAQEQNSLPTLETATEVAEASQPTEDEAKSNADSKKGDWATWKYYLRALSPQRIIMFLVIVGINELSVGLQSAWLNLWGESNEAGDTRLGYWLGLYGTFCVSDSIAQVMAIVFLWMFVVPRSGKNLHKAVLTAAMKAPMSFFAATETGILVNRFSQDLRMADMQLPGAIINCAFQAGSCLVVLALSIVSVGYFAAVLPVVAAVLYFIQRFYLRTSKQLRLLELEANAPLFAHFIESLHGLVTIRAFGWNAQQTAKNRRLIDRAQRPYYLLLCIQRWLVLVLDLVVAGLAVLLVGMAVALRSSLNAGFLGIALVSMMSLSHALTNLVQFWTTLETSLGAIARIKSFSDETPEEASPGENDSPDPSWPSRGAIRFEDVSASYAKDGNLVLKGLSFDVKPGEKVGIIGRTGSGKSSTALALLRMIDIVSGKIVLDDVDLATLTGSSIRERLVCLTQDPFIFSASVRRNVDPFESSTDNAIVSAFEKVGIWGVLQAKAGGGLDTEYDVLNMSMDLNLLSHGQRQLFCLARALLRPGKVLVLDEPTSSVDEKTDTHMQDIIRSEFKDHTIIMIAHRLASLGDFDRVLVLDSGRMVEFGKPSELLRDKSSLFAGLYNHAVPQ